MDEKIKQLLRELGNAINESISASPHVNQHIQKIRDEGYNLYVVLDATIGLGKNDAEAAAKGKQSTTATNEITFRININDLGFLRSIGIDPTRKVRVPKRLEGQVEPATPPAPAEGERGRGGEGAS